MDSAAAVRDLLEERPDLEPAVEAVLEPDPPFDFDDVAVDSGAFGELVSRGIVEKTDGGYHVHDGSAVERALAGDVRDDSPRSVGRLSDLSLPVSRLELAFLAGALALVVGFRLLALPNVYHGGEVVLSGNDPYLYRYLVEGLLADPNVTPDDIPRDVRVGEPLMVTTLWAASVLLGGVSAAGHVMAWFPIVSAVLTGLLVYVLAVVVTDDRRIGLATVVLLAVLPGHAFRSSLGFADHHPFDYPWVVLTLLGIAVVVAAARREERPSGLRTIAAILAIGAGIGGGILAWDNSPILIVPVGLVVAAEGLRAVHADDPPHRTLVPILLGTAIGAAVAWAAHAALDWHTTLVAGAPALVLVGGVGVLLAAEVTYRLDLPVVPLGVAELVGLPIAAFALQTLWPEFWNRLVTSLTDRLLAYRSIAEVDSLFADSGGWLLLFGFLLILGLPYLVWATAKTVDDSRWLPPVVYGWYFFALSTIQVRFVGHLAPVIVVFAGLGFVHLAERIDVAHRPAPFTDVEPPELTLPEPRQLGALFLLFLLVGGLSVVQVPVKTSQVAIPQEQSETAFFVAEYSDDSGLEYPENYVFSRWGRNRMYNYFVSGESRSYGYAQSNYAQFVASTDPGGWYDRLGNRRGFVVTSPEVVGADDAIGTRLHRDDGTGSDSTAALARYRLIHVSDDGTFKVFSVVPGAVIEGTAAANATVTAETEVSVDSVSLAYARSDETNADGEYAIRVAHPGEYEVGDATVRVNESAVRNGTAVAAA